MRNSLYGLQRTTDRRIPHRAAVVAGSLALAVGVYLGLMEGWMRAFEEWTASLTAAALSILGFSVAVEGTVLRTSDFAANIVTECTTIGPLIVFLGAVAAYPATLKAKAGGAVSGIVILTAVNFCRTVSLFWIGSSYPQYLRITHLLIWQTAIVVLAIVLWLGWTERFARARSA